MGHMARTIRNFEVMEKIGMGGMAVIYKAKQTSLDRIVAIKELHAHLASDKEIIDRFEKEAKSVAKLQHENLVNIIDYGKEGNSYFIAMEYVEGGLTFKDLLGKVKKFPVTVALRVVTEVLKGLEYAHDKGIFHRDIKPANVMISKDGAVKIADFGIAKNLEQAGQTKTGQAVGTPAYMSPEQLAGRKVDQRTDLFSLGVMFYEILGGIRPFPGDTLHTIITQIIQTTPRPVEELDPLIPPEISKVVVKALEKDMDKRYSSATEMLKDLQDYMQKESISLTKKDMAAFVNDPNSYLQKQKQQDITEFMDRGSYFMNLGIGRIDDAIAEFKKVTLIDPNHSQAKELLEKLEKEKAKAPPPKKAEKLAAKPAPTPKEAKRAPAVAAAPVAAPGAGISRIAMIAGGVVALVGISIGSYFLLQSSTPREGKVETSQAANLPAPASGAATAFLSVNTEPGGAVIIIDGKSVSDKSPTVIANVTPGEHRIVLKKDGYTDQEQRINLTPGTTGKIDAILQQIPRAHEAKPEAPKKEASIPKPKDIEPGFLKIRVSGAPWAKVYVDDAYIDQTPIASPIKVQAGKHTLTLENPNFPKYTESIVIASNKTLEKTVVLKIPEPALLKVNVTPWADVYVDGKKVATTPIAAPLKITPGTHTILLSNPGCEEWFESIDFKSGQTVKKIVSLKVKK